MPLSLVVGVVGIVGRLELFPISANTLVSAKLLELAKLLGFFGFIVVFEFVWEFKN